MFISVVELFQRKKKYVFISSTSFSYRIVNWNRKKVLQPAMLTHALLVLVCLQANIMMVPKFQVLLNAFRAAFRI
jgi:hypothetical protein